MIRTRICNLLNIKYPIIQASMAWATNAEMVAAISEAGGMGTLGPNAGQKTVTRDPYETGERLRDQIRKVKNYTNKPFAVNIIVPSNEIEKKFSDYCLKVTIDENVPVAVVSQGSPNVYTKTLKEVGIKVLHVISNKRHAIKCEQADVDAVITSGTEGGGHSGFGRLTTFTLVPWVADSIRIPIIAGGGIADGRGLVAALALGADGVYMGTRFLATQECPIHPNVKELLLKTDGTNTVSIIHGGYPFEESTDLISEVRRGSLRLIINDYVRELLKLQAEGKQKEFENLLNSPPPYRDDISRTMASAVYGDLTHGWLGAGQEVGLINDIPTCKELIERIAKEAEEILKKLQNLKIS